MKFKKGRGCHPHSAQTLAIVIGVIRRKRSTKVENVHVITNTPGRRLDTFPVSTVEHVTTVVNVSDL